MSATNEPTARLCDMAEHVRLRLERAHQASDTRETPFVTMTYAQSLDGSIAKSEGETTVLSNRHSQRLTHQVRAVHDAILVGINTVLRDDPRLNVRLVDGKNPQPIVVDSRLRFPLDAKLLRSPCERPWIFTHPDSCKTKEAKLAEHGATVLRVGGRRDGWIDLPLLLCHLKAQGIRSVMIEGGASIITSVLRSRLADQVLLTVSPRFLGGLPSMHRMHGKDALHTPHLCNLAYEWLAEDLIVCGDLELHDPEAVEAEAGKALAETTLRAKGGGQ